MYLAVRAFGGESLDVDARSSDPSAAKGPTLNQGIEVVYGSVSGITDRITQCVLRVVLEHLALPTPELSGEQSTPQFGRSNVC